MAVIWPFVLLYLAAGSIAQIAAGNSYGVAVNAGVLLGRIVAVGTGVLPGVLVGCGVAVNAGVLLGRIVAVGTGVGYVTVAGSARIINESSAIFPVTRVMETVFVPLGRTNATGAQKKLVALLVIVWHDPPFTHKLNVLGAVNIYLQTISVFPRTLNETELLPVVV